MADEKSDEKQKEGTKDTIDEAALLGRLEAALFLAARWLSLNEIVTLSSINPMTARELLQKLEQKYNQGGITLLKRDVQGEEVWKMDVKQEYSNLVSRLATGQAEFTKAEQATLAIIAYKQPIKQSVIVKIRGNKAYDHIKNLITANLVQAKKAGRTFVLTLNDSFYNYFDLKTKDNQEKNADNPRHELFDLFGKV